MSDRSTAQTPIILEGAIDMHCHFGPEQLVSSLTGAPHAVDPIQAAEEAAAVGISAIVLKAHEFASTIAAYTATQAVPEVESISSICLDHPVGGLNPHAAETALINGAQVVWLPTISVHADPPTVLRKAFGVSEGIRLLDDEGELLPVVREIFALVQEHDAVLATGHISREEHFQVARHFHTPDRLIVTHAMHQTAGPALTVDECVQLADMGATIEFAAHTCMGTPSMLSEVSRAIQRVGAERVALATDYGWIDSAPHPAAGLIGYVNALWEHGAAEAELRTMTSTVPARLLGKA